MNILFVCTFNKWRSLTAEHIFKNLPGQSVCSAGTSARARIKITNQLITWADIIFVMEKNHWQILTERFDKALDSKKIVCLNIPSGYRYMDEDLVKMLKEGVKEYLDM